MSDSKRPENVGILAMDIYFPRQYVDQSDLEVFSKVSTGKFTLGLGQQGLAFVDDRQDIYSITLTAVANFMEKYEIPYTDIGRLEVGSETILDHSKAIKTYLMQLFEESGNSDVEGIDSMNACYAGTNALFNSVAWVESRAWDGRYALVVASDIAEYAEGNARPTGGCGSVVFLIGPNAPLVIDPIRATHMAHVYDFYKPNLTSPYPVVDGQFSNKCYLHALDTCIERWMNKVNRQTGQPVEILESDYFVFHAPYNKLVQKSLGRVMYNDFKMHPERPEYKNLQEHLKVCTEDSYDCRELIKAFTKASKDIYQSKMSQSTLIPIHLGNLYTASIYGGLLSLVYNEAENMAGKSVLCFSYGSGLASSLFTLNVPDSPDARAQLNKIRQVTDMKARLEDRSKRTPEEFARTMSIREGLHEQHGAFRPNGAVDSDSLAVGTFFLTEKDGRGRRFYQRFGHDAPDSPSSGHPNACRL